MHNDNKNYLIKKKEFMGRLRNEVFPKIAVYDKKRIQYLCWVIFVSFVVLAISIFLLCLGHSDGIIKLIAILCFLPVLLYQILKSNLKEKFDKKIMRQVCKSFGEFEWKNNYKGDDATYYKSFVIPFHDSVEHDDCFIGKYHDVDIIIDEADYKVKRRSKNGTYYASVFRGLVITLQFNKNFKSHTVVKNDTLFHNSPSAKLRHTVLEDVEFEKKYDVFTNDEVEARYLLTTAFMERLNNMKMSFKCRNITCAFYQNSLYISLNTGKDMFSMGSLFKSVLEEKQYNDIFDELYSVLSIIDVLKLNQKIGL